jgi:hypothetical protein
VTSIQAGCSEGEWRKRLTALLQGGRLFVSIDNIRGLLDSSALASALTQPWIEDRILQKSVTVRMHVRCVWCANGNNVQPSAEIARRTVWIRLDSNRERPWERTDFRHPDLLGWAKAHRGELVTAALILIQAWVQAGMPAGPYVKGSYDRWAQVMGGILDTASIPGFLANERELFDTAVDSHASWRFFVEAWHAAYGTRAVTVGDLPPHALGTRTRRAARQDGRDLQDRPGGRNTRRASLAPGGPAGGVGPAC